MSKRRFYWEPEIISRMSTKAIEAKMKELVPGFSRNEFVTKTNLYISYEDLADEEYYPQAAYLDEDEDFIWMACDELWKRLVPERLSVEHVAKQFDTLLEQIFDAEDDENWKGFDRRIQEAVDLIYLYLVEPTPSGYKLLPDFFDRFCDETCYDFDNVVKHLIVGLMSTRQYDSVIDLAEVFGEALGDDELLACKASTLFTSGRKDEGIRCYEEIIARNPDDPLFVLNLGDLYLAEKDYAKAKTCYHKALELAEKARNQPGGLRFLRWVYQSLLELAVEMEDYREIAHYQQLLNSTEVKKVRRNDPCPCGSGKKYKKCCGRDVTATAQPLSFDRRLMERDLLALKQLVEDKKFESPEEANRYLDQLNGMGERLQWVPQTPLEKAQGFIFLALEAVGEERLVLVEEALKTSPDCADAYVLLAEEKAQSIEEAAKLYEAGVKAGERALGKKVFKKDAGHFWGVVETRPYMRARTGLAQCLWLLGKHQDAMHHYQELLRLNPNDNQGIRYLLGAALLETGQIRALQKLLRQYDEISAAWLYTHALVTYIKDGDNAKTRKRLMEALDYNPHVVPYLVGEKKLPAQLPQHIGSGDKDEAIIYAAEFGTGWHQTEGAIDWLISISGSVRGAWQADKKTAGIPEVFLRAFESEDKQHHPKKQTGDE